MREGKGVKSQSSDSVRLYTVDSYNKLRHIIIEVLSYKPYKIVNHKRSDKRTQNNKGRIQHAF